MVHWLCVVVILLAVPCGTSLNLRTPASQIEVLQNLFDSTNGASWNMISMADYLDRYDLVLLVKNIDIEYVVDPCGNDVAGSQFTGLKCTCNTTACNVMGIATVCGNLQGMIPVELGQLTSHHWILAATPCAARFLSSLVI